MTNKPSVPLDFSGRDELLKDPKHAVAYLEECFVDGNLELFQEALRDVAKAQGGMSALARETKISREALYRALSKKGNPQFETIFKVVSAMGFKFSIVPDAVA